MKLRKQFPCETCLQDPIPSVTRRVPQTRQMRVGTDDRAPVGSARAQSDPGPAEKNIAKGRKQAADYRADVIKPGCGNRHVEAGIFHRRSGDSPTGLWQHITACPVHDYFRAAVGPVHCRYLPTDRLNRQRSREAQQLSRPGTARYKYGTCVMVLS